MCERTDRPDGDESGTLRVDGLNERKARSTLASDLWLRTQSAAAMCVAGTGVRTMQNAIQRGLRSDAGGRAPEHERRILNDEFEVLGDLVLVDNFAHAHADFIPLPASLAASTWP